MGLNDLDQIPNGLGLLFGLAQMVLHGAYYKSTKKLLAARKSKDVIDLSDVVVAEEPKKLPIITTPPNGLDSDK